MASPMTFTLPVRAAKASTSVTLAPSFTLCYENTPEALNHLFSKKAPLPLQVFYNNKEFMDYLMSKEPGPTVQHENLRPALSALRAWLRASAAGVQLLAFYKEFLQLHGQWVLAAVEQEAFEIHTQLIRAMYIDKDDERLIAHLEKHVPGSASKMASSPAVNREQWDTATTKRLAQLKQATATVAERLYAFKTSEAFWKNHGRLLAAIEAAEKKVQMLRARANLRGSKALNSRARNDRHATRQLGTSGTRDLPPHVENSVRDFTLEEKTSYFNFNETISEA